MSVEMLPYKPTADQFMWYCIYAHNSLEYIREYHPSVYAECGDASFYPERERMIASTNQPNQELVIPLDISSRPT